MTQKPPKDWPSRLQRPSLLVLGTSAARTRSASRTIESALRGGRMLWRVLDFALGLAAAHALACGACAGKRRGEAAGLHAQGAAT